jgi:hypothetical protein
MSNKRKGWVLFLGDWLGFVSQIFAVEAGGPRADAWVIGGGEWRLRGRRWGGRWGGRWLRLDGGWWRRFGRLLFSGLPQFAERAVRVFVDAVES